MIKIAVLGYGTIGSGVVEVLETNREHITQTAGQEIEVKYVLDLRDFPGDPIQDKIVHDYEIIKNDPEIQIVVEAMGGVEPAYTFVKGALLEGKHVATSNKALVAKHGAELLEIAKEREINFLFEASVGGGIPIIRPLVTSLTAGRFCDSCRNDMANTFQNAYQKKEPPKPKSSRVISERDKMRYLDR